MFITHPVNNYPLYTLLSLRIFFSAFLKPTSFLWFWLILDIVIFQQFRHIKSQQKHEKLCDGSGKLLPKPKPRPKPMASDMTEQRYQEASTAAQSVLSIPVQVSSPDNAQHVTAPSAGSDYMFPQNMPPVNPLTGLPFSQMYPYGYS